MLEPEGKVQAAPHTKILLFPWKVHEMLRKAEADGKKDVFSWLPAGNCFRVHHKKRFCAEIMPAFFSSSKYKTFQRSLNVWGFQRVSKGSFRGALYHQYFVKGYPDLCHRMTRQTCKARRSPEKLVSAARSETRAALVTSLIMNQQKIWMDLDSFASVPTEAKKRRGNKNINESSSQRKDLFPREFVKAQPLPPQPSMPTTHPTSDSRSIAGMCRNGSSVDRTPTLPTSCHQHPTPKAQPAIEAIQTHRFFLDCRTTSRMALLLSEATTTPAQSEDAPPKHHNESHGNEGNDDDDLSTAEFFALPSSRPLDHRSCLPPVATAHTGSTWFDQPEDDLSLAEFDPRPLLPVAVVSRNQHHATEKSKKLWNRSIIPIETTSSGGGEGRGEWPMFLDLLPPIRTDHP